MHRSISSFIRIPAAEAPKIIYDTKGAYTTKFRFDIKNHVLRINEKADSRRPEQTIVTVYYNSLESLSLFDATASFREPIIADLFDLTIGSRAALTTTLDVKDLKMNVTGNSSATLDGSARYLTLDASTGKVDALNSGRDGGTGQCDLRCIRHARCHGTIGSNDLHQRNGLLQNRTEYHAWRYPFHGRQYRASQITALSRSPYAEFLDEVAARLYTRYGEELADRALLFPSRRARLFFTDSLSRIVKGPIWQPQWVTIDDLMSEISGLRIGERVRLITELYKVYSSYHEEAFDKFYFWGDMLLTDFDTIDKYRIDADMLFRNISDLKELEADISYLTPSQLEIIRTFWSSFGEEADLSEEKRRFLAIWKTLGPIYRAFRKQLESLGIAYNGMVQRAAAERLQEGSFTFSELRRYVVAGFNALSEMRKNAFRIFSDECRN